MPRGFVACALVLSACAKSGASVPPAGPPAANQLRVVSYNVNFGLAGDLEGVRALDGMHADLVFLQETNPAWEDALVGAFQRRYPHHRFAPPIDMPAGGMGVMSRFPIASIEHLPPATGGLFFAWRVVIDTSLGRLQVLDVHLRPPISDGGSWVAGYFTTREDRLREIEYHLARLDRSLPTLIVGDFNEEHGGLALGRLTQLGYHDAVAQYAGPRRTWEWTVSSGVTLSFQLDHILYDERLIAVRGGVHEAGRSDHKPIWADFERP
ncbi:MAG TPA: endonuclease/exonuclease/phosphatase family protein [Kofleriaceae bacterium]|nr:endonuclease/exonuclease/phosphatase family protein [Kofleriaceae bacterium]